MKCSLLFKRGRRLCASLTHSVSIVSTVGTGVVCFLLLDFNWLRLQWQFTPNMENCEQADGEELPTFSLRMEFLTPQKERKVKENKEQARPSSRFATLVSPGWKISWQRDTLKEPTK